MLYAEPNVEIPRSQGLLAFLKFSGNAGNNSIVNVVSSAGLTYAGLIPGRDQDMSGIGVAYAQFNPNASSYYASLYGLQPSTSETTIEAVYAAQLTPWLMLIGSYQYIFNPSSFGAMNPAFPNGHVVLLNTRINF
jgi:porin